MAEASNSKTVISTVAKAGQWAETVRDPATGLAVQLFHPRKQQWNHHFRWIGSVVVGITATGRATIDALALNSPAHRIVRSFETTLGRHPPPGHV